MLHLLCCIAVVVVCLVQVGYGVCKHASITRANAKQW